MVQVAVLKHTVLDVCKGLRQFRIGLIEHKAGRERLLPDEGDFNPVFHLHSGIVNHFVGYRYVCFVVQERLQDIGI